MKYSKEHFINRELSWLEFNRRVLEEAQDPSQPLLERVKFLSIFSSNLDEFFEIRVAGIKQQIAYGSNDFGPDEIPPQELFYKIQKIVHSLERDMYKLWQEEIHPALNKQGISIEKVQTLGLDEKEFLKNYLKKQLFPVLTPIAVDAAHPFPQIPNKLVSLLFELSVEGGSDGSSLAVVQLPRVLPRLVSVPAISKEVTDSQKFSVRYVYLTDLVATFAEEIFPGCSIKSAYPFRVTRNSDLYIDEEEAENLLRTIEMSLRKRNRGDAVRLQVLKGMPERLCNFLLENTKLAESDVYQCDEPINMQHLNEIAFHPDFPHLRDKMFIPGHDMALTARCDTFEAIRKQDILLHHPYESFDDIVEWIKDAAHDPAVLAIKITLYRTSGDSPIVNYLIEAAENGKQVTAVVEIKARFDEQNNITWAKRMEDSGVNVIYGVVGLKTHCKTMLIVRRDPDRLRMYAHLATGNYHPKTARIYTDLGLLTCRDDVTNEVALLFNILTGVTKYPGFKNLMIAPFDLAERLQALINRETKHASEGKPARIIMKLNSLVDEMIIKLLYDASRAGVKIDLVVRGICCLKPGLRGISENINVISIVGRFLEHSRIFYFENAGQPEVFLGSADLMPRNLYRRVEVVFPILCPNLRKHIIEDILNVFLADRVKARKLMPDGTYVRLKPGPGESPSAAQLTFREQVRKQIASLSIAAPRESGELIPVKAV